MNARMLGIYREPEFSPGKVEADAAIFDAVLDDLRERGNEIAAIDANRLIDLAPDGFNLVLAMCQSGRALDQLAVLEARGALVVNSPRSIRTCYRDRLGQALLRAGVPTPPGRLVSTSQSLDPESLGFECAAGVFIKRGDLHALSADDVIKVERVERISSELARFAARGIACAYVQQAVEGAVIKFYGVSGGEYFAPVIDGVPLGEMVKKNLRDAANRAAQALGLEIWGGDAIVSDSDFAIIDFNDWPSFSRVRDRAARAIANRCAELWSLRRLEKQENKGAAS
jgi:glutathione synthase/RimK-type ligase-like ATP-grasp enzyme